VERKPNFGLWLSGVSIPVWGYILENPHSCKDTKFATPLDFLQGAYHGQWTDTIIKACDTCDMTCDMWAGKVNFGHSFPCALGLSASIGFYTVSFSTDSKQYLTGIKTELSFATETINQTRPWIALTLLIYSSSRGRLLSRYSSQLLLFGIGGKKSLSVPEPRNGKLRKYCLLYSSGETLESIAQSLSTLMINEDTTANVY